MSVSAPQPSDLHRVAAVDHETAAKLHREIADLHDQYKHAEAKTAAEAMLEKGLQAHNQTIDACHATRGQMTE